MSHRLRWIVWLGVCVLAGCGGGGASPSSASNTSSSGSSTSSSSSSSSSGATVSNIIAVVVNQGPAAANGGTFNIPYVSVTLCKPGTTTCRTITNMLVDTGSVGVRVMASALAATGLSLTNTPDPTTPGNSIAECLPFADGFTWGPIATADVKLGGEIASDVSVNIINDNGSYGAAPPTSCTTGLSQSSNSLNSVTAFAANGVLGVGTSDQDCGPSCANCASFLPNHCNTTNSDLYYSCNTMTNSCSFTPVAEDAQVRNPVVLFATDNNGVILTLQPIAAAGQASATGTLIFGIETQANNTLGSAFVLQTDSGGNFTTLYQSQTLDGSFIDSGSNALFFPDSSLAVCPNTMGNPNASDFYCPSPTPQAEAATMQGQDGLTNPVAFSVMSLNSIGPTIYASSELAGPAATNAALGNYFDWGLPFFYGKRVYTAIEGKNVGATAVGPFYAF